MPRLLVISCSAKKRADGGRMPAIERYDGPAFRVLRKYLREAPASDLTVFVLSGRFGLIASTRRIPSYDQRMSSDRAAQLRRTVLARLRRAYIRTTDLEIGICLGREYRGAVAGLERVVPSTVRVMVIGGGLGRRLANLREWLRSSRPVRAITE